MQKILTTTEDGSHTLYVPELNEHYHSFHGAVTESECVYIRNGFLKAVSGGISCVNILEVGFGTGLNALLTFYASGKLQKPVYYYAIEPYPISQDSMKQLNFDRILEESNAGDILALMHQSLKDDNSFWGDLFRFRLDNTRIEEFKFKKAFFNLIYFDAFSPDVQPEMWSSDIFMNMYDLLAENGILVTYCAKGAVKRILRDIGFSVEGLPGPPRKREVLRAVKRG